MLIDARASEPDTTVECDLCVVGAGAAGIAIAREFQGSDLRVYVVESGGLEGDEKTQALCEGQNIGLPYFPLDHSRLRFFGGSTNHWAGQCGPLMNIDFETRPWVPYSGWPISKSDLDPFYEKALPVIHLWPNVFDKRAWSFFDVEAPPFLPEKIQYHFWQRSKDPRKGENNDPNYIYYTPLKFGPVYLDELKRAENITVLLNANATEFVTDKHGQSVAHLNISTLEGIRGKIKAKQYILACGGIENARMLLLSKQADGKGLGNQHDLVGRFFMEHPVTRCGMLVGADENALLEAFEFRFYEGMRFRPGMAMSGDVQASEKCLNVACTFDPEEEIHPGLESAREIFHSMKAMKIPNKFTEHIQTIISDLGQVSDYAFCRLKGHTYCSHEINLYVRMEQAPDPNSRVTLSTARDALGLNRVNLDWRLTDMQRRTARAMMTCLGSEFGRLKIGRIQLADWLEKDQDPEWEGSYHHMGTTRMSDDPKMGVVDKDCRVHGMSNLYVAGSSVFPTSGFVNPTFTIVALALRLADHVKSRLS